jgi:hypothetical protein
LRRDVVESRRDHPASRRRFLPVTQEPDLLRRERHIDMRDAEGRERVTTALTTAGWTDGSRFADAFDAEGFTGVGVSVRASFNAAGRRAQRVIHQAAGKQLAVFVVNHFLEKRLSQTLNDAALDLSIDEQRIDDFAAVVHRDVFLIPRCRSRLDFRHADMRAEEKVKLDGSSRLRG